MTTRSPAACSASMASVSSSAARVWITTGLPARARQLHLRDERADLVLARRVVAVVVEPGLPDRDAALVGRQRLELGQVGVVEAGRAVGMAADRRADLREGLGRRQRRAARRAVHPDRQHPAHAGALRVGDQIGVVRGEQ